jgi:ketosteroid isomerase-like protein
MKELSIAGIIILLICFSSCKERFSRADIINSIDSLMSEQEAAWNNGDIEAFMQGYWKSDSLQFISSRGINRGWQNTLDGYRRGYPDKESMGQLRFEVLDYKPVSGEACLVTGKFYLTRAAGDLSGIFTLLFQKKNGKWVIVYDHTS